MKTIEDTEKKNVILLFMTAGETEYRQNQHFIKNLWKIVYSKSKIKISFTTPTHCVGFISQQVEEATRVNHEQSEFNHYYPFQTLQWLICCICPYIIGKANSVETLDIILRITELDFS